MFSFGDFVFSPSSYSAVVSFCVGSVRAGSKITTCSGCEVICNFIETETKGNMPYLFLFPFYFLCLFLCRFAAVAFCLYYLYSRPYAAHAQSVISRVTAPFIENALRIIIIYVYAPCARARRQQRAQHTPLFI